MSKRIVSAALLLCALAACGDPAGPTPSKVTAIVISGPSTAVLRGETRKLTATLSYDGPPPAVPPVLTWSSSSPTALSVDNDGNVTGLAFGATTVTITARAQGKEGSIDVAVRDPLGYSIYPSPAFLSAGETKSLGIREYPSGRLSVRTVVANWTSDQPEILAVDSAGVLTGFKAGTATIRVTYDQVPLSLAITVLPAPHLSFTSVAGGPLPLWNTGFGSSPGDRNCGLAAGVVYCWGRPGKGFSPTDGCVQQMVQVFTVNTYCSTTPVRLSVNATFASLSIGDGKDGCALTVDGDVYCFGISEYSLTYFTEHDPVRINSADQFRAIFAGSEQPCAIKKNGTAACWGNAIGPTPKDISTFAWNTLAERGRCGIAVDSTAYCWAADAAKVWISAVGLPYHWTHIDVSERGYGEFNTNAWGCALASTGELACWRFASGGEPQQPVMLSNPGLVSLGSMRTARFDQTQSCGLTGGGDMYCVAVTETASGPTFAVRPLDLGVKLKSFSGNCGIALDGKAYCWHYGATMKAVLAPGQ